MIAKYWLLRKATGTGLIDEKKEDRYRRDEKTDERSKERSKDRRMRTRGDKRPSRKNDRKVLVAEESNRNWADTDSDSSSSSSSSSDSEQEEVYCLMADQTSDDEVFDFSNIEFTREDLVSALNDMFKEYRKHSHTFEEVKIENADLKNSPVEPSTVELGEAFLRVLQLLLNRLLNMLLPLLHISMNSLHCFELLFLRILSSNCAHKAKLAISIMPVFSKIDTYEKAAAEARVEQDQSFRSIFKSLRQGAHTDTAALSVELHEFKKTVRTQNAFVTTDLADLRKDVKNIKADLSKDFDDKLAVIHNDLLEFRVETQGQLTSLGTNLAELIAFITKDSDDKKGEVSSSHGRGQPPPDNQSRPSGGSASRSGGDGSSRRRDDRRVSLTKRGSSSGGGGSGTGGPYKKKR
ncbi:hypothetical protein F511_43039 [Dorcoceras hygrometricum]|uniref:Uncharacterized protein n=1 Tax=Dorcoceras hygrometricum TaxID=472368 RepID=A0A2Z7AY00_9LAMI|nr:hypothetical protein F511_43039 [Dorcoceras hygrometricum]